MKKTTKLGLLGIFASACALNPLNTQALSNTLPAAENGVIKLTEDVEINWWKNTGKVTIDLNGKTLKRTGDGYLIDNNTKDSDLTIIDSSSNKEGKIVCDKEPTPTRKSSCIRNNGTLEIDGVKSLTSYYHALKNEELSTMTVKNSNIAATANVASGIQNFGTLTVENSFIEGAKDPEGAAIFSLSWEDKGTPYSSNATIKNSTLYAYWPVIIEECNNNAPIEGEDVVVNIEDSELLYDAEGRRAGDGIARIQGMLNRSQDEAFELHLKGNIEASSDALNYLEEGSKLTLNQNLTEEIIIPVGISLVVGQGIDVSEGKIIFEEGAIIENKSGKDIVVYASLDGEEKEVNVPDGTAVSKYEEEKPSEPTDPTEPSEPVGPVDPNHPTEEPSDKPSEDIKNPQTFDGVTIYAALAIVSVGGLGLVLKKRLD